MRPATWFCNMYNCYFEVFKNQDRKIDCKIIIASSMTAFLRLRDQNWRSQMPILVRMSEVRQYCIALCLGRPVYILIFVRVIGVLFS